MQSVYEKYPCKEFIKRHATAKYSSSKFYKLLANIKQRCFNQNNKSFKWYGKRRIGCLLTVEDVITLWYRDKAWRLTKPSIDRINNNGHYVFGNCRFIELSENSKKSTVDRKFNKPLVDNNLYN